MFFQTTRGSLDFSKDLAGGVDCESLEKSKSVQSPLLASSLRILHTEKGFSSEYSIEGSTHTRILMVGGLVDGFFLTGILL